MIIYSGPKGDILNMPTSSITFNEWNRIAQVMSWKLGNDSFDRLFSKGETTVREGYALNVAMQELLGSQEN